MKDILKNHLQQVERLKKMENKKIPEDIDYDVIHGIATEAHQKLNRSASAISIAKRLEFQVLILLISQFYLFIWNKGNLPVQRETTYKE